MAVDDSQCVVEVRSSFSGESLSSFWLPGSSQVLQIKLRVQAVHGIGVFCQQLLLRPAGRTLGDHDVLASLTGFPPG
eukprot:15701241-Heterocapsa_arctica.AAC.1